MSDKEECMFCKGHGAIEEWNELTHEWEDFTCPDCGGTGLEDDPEGQ